MKIVRGHNISDLNLSDCSLGTETIKEMLENVEDYQVVFQITIQWKLVIVQADLSSRDFAEANEMHSG